MFTRRTALLVVVAIFAPLAIALVFPHPTDRIVLPVALMLAVVVLVTWNGGFVVGAIATVSSFASAWYFNTPPGDTFLVDSADDAIALVVVLILGLGMALLLAVVRARDREASRLSALLEWELVQELSNIETMQRALLPTRPHTIPGVEIAASHVVGGGAGAPVGGDWFTFVPLGPHRLGVAIGDVVGHGVQAVSTMADFRYSLRAVALDGCSPDMALTRLNAALNVYASDQMGTCVYGVLDASTGSWVQSNAGHLPPILTRATGEYELIEGRATPLLGLRMPDLTYECVTAMLHAGDLLVLYTDGLVERRAESLDVGIARLVESLAAHQSDDLTIWAETVIEDLVGDTPDDDIALVMLRFTKAEEAGAS